MTLRKSDFEGGGQEMSQLRNEMLLAPIALFAFKRPAHTRRALESLAQNPEFAESPLFIYCDGARHDIESAQVEQTRQLVHAWPHPQKTVIERDRNWGLADSIIAGVTELCSRFGRVIVVEDDLIVSPVFLNYLNAALEHYADEPKVMQISAHMFPVPIQSQYDAVMLPFTTSWGWATWDRAWKHFDPNMSGFEKLKTDRALRRKFDLDGVYPYSRMLKHQADGKVDSWSIRWNWSVFKQNGLVLFPPVPYVLNVGFDGSGTHCGKIDQVEIGAERVFEVCCGLPDRVEVNEGYYNAVKHSIGRMRGSKIRNFVRRFKFYIRINK
jgi:hypothetical protein